MGQLSSMKRCMSCTIAHHSCVGGIPQYLGAIIEKANMVSSTGSGSLLKAKTVKATVSAADVTGLPEETSVFDVKGSWIRFVGRLKEEVFAEKGIKKRSAILQGIKGEVLVTKLARTSSSSLCPISSILSSSSSHLAANPKSTSGLSPLLITSLISESGVDDLVLHLLDSVDMSIIHGNLNKAHVHLRDARKHYKASKRA